MKALSPIVSSASDKVIDVIEQQSEKAPCIILVTLLGIESDEMAVLLKA
jgi:hypothetical protein